MSTTGSPGPPPIGAAATPPDAHAVAAAFGLGRPIGTPTLSARGELGRLWRLDTTTGTWAVKELLRPGSEADAAADVAFQEAALAAGIPMPRPRLARDGRVLVRVATVDPSLTVRVYTWLDLAGRQARAPAEDAAAILGRLHALAFPDDRAPDPWFTRAVTRERWWALERAAVAAGVAWAPVLERVIPAILGGDAIVAAGRHEPTIRCHLDVNPENVLVDVHGRTVLVDWENAGPASPEQELASVVAEFVPDPARVVPFLRAYEAAGGAARLRDRSSFAMTLAVQSNLVAWYAERALDSATADEDRARSEHWIQDIAANVFTPARIDAWLAAALERTRR